MRMVKLLAAFTIFFAFAAPAFAQDKITLSKDDSFDVLAKKMVDFGTGVGGNVGCTPGGENPKVKYKLVANWLDKTQPVRKAEILKDIITDTILITADETFDLVSQETPPPICEQYKALYNRLVFPE